MRERFPAWTIISVLLVWTAGVLVLWFIANATLNEGVSDADIRECMEEGFIPANECRDVLEELEEEEDPIVGISSTVLVWVVGLVLLVWLLRPREPTQGN